MRVKAPFGNCRIYDLRDYNGGMDVGIKRTLVEDAQDHLEQKGLDGPVDLVDYFHKRKNLVFFQSTLPGAAATDSLLTMEVEERGRLYLIHLPTCSSAPLCWRKGDGNEYCRRVPDGGSADFSCGVHTVPHKMTLVNHPVGWVRDDLRIYPADAIAFMGDDKGGMDAARRIAVGALLSRVCSIAGLKLASELTEELHWAIGGFLENRAFNYGHVGLAYNQRADQYLMKFGDEGHWTALCGHSGCLEMRVNDRSLYCPQHCQSVVRSVNDHKAQMLETLFHGLGVANRRQVTAASVAGMLQRLNGCNGELAVVVRKEFVDSVVVITRELHGGLQYIVASRTRKSDMATFRFVFCRNLLQGCFSISTITNPSCPDCFVQTGFIVRLVRGSHAIFEILKKRIMECVKEDDECLALNNNYFRHGTDQYEIVWSYRGAEAKGDADSLVIALRLALYIEAVELGEEVEVTERRVAVGTKVLHYLGWLLQLCGLQLKLTERMSERLQRPAETLYNDVEKGKRDEDKLIIYELGSRLTGKVYVGSNSRLDNSIGADYHSRVGDPSNFRLIRQEDGPGVRQRERVIGELAAGKDPRARALNLHTLERVESILTLSRLLASEKLDNGPTTLVNGFIQRLGGLGANSFLYHLSQSMLFRYGRTIGWEGEVKRYFTDPTRARASSSCYDNWDSS